MAEEIVLACLIPNITSEHFSCLRNLEWLDLGNNGLTTIVDLTFKGLGKLSFLDLTLNMISYITDNSFLGLDSLETLMLHITTSAFIHLTSLKSVHL